MDHDDAMPQSLIASYSETDIRVRDRDITELIGQASFAAMFLLQARGAMPSPGEVRVLDACLVALMEHGLTATALAARLTLHGAPEAFQGAVAAGLLGAGSRFLGTVEGAAKLLQQAVNAANDGPEEPMDVCRQIVAQHLADARRVPGFGHNVHRGGDPRMQALLEVGRQAGIRAEHVAMLETLRGAMTEAGLPELVVNATGAVAALVSDLGIPWHGAKGVALVARCAGLTGHLIEEADHPIAGHVWTHAASTFQER